ncbi:MAG: formylmethanofuran dehydrogenase subunit E family protein [Methanobacteriota archaeon]|nr:MAG: formylmethanofuran dehydrogenase subunit E family protein [Euryarchaeota archaeon]
MSSDAVLRRISDFHGHIGPFVVIGYRMGLVANKLLGVDPFAKTAVAFTGGKPPRSCLVDGIQLSSGCTLGKGNIDVVDLGEVAALFESKAGDRRVKVTLQAKLLETISATPSERLESLARDFYSLSDDDLFEVSDES